MKFWKIFETLTVFVITICLGVIVFQGCNDVDHKVEGDVDTEHHISIDLEMCKEPEGHYRAACVDKFLEAWKGSKCREDPKK